MNINKKLFLSLGMVGLLVSMQGCVKYKANDKSFIVADNQPNVVVTIGESYNTFLYNLKKPVELVIKAPDDQLILYKDGQTQQSYRMKLNPQQSVNLLFNLVNKEDIKKLDDKSKIDKSKRDYLIRVKTFKSSYFMPNAIEHYEKSGKTTRLVGYDMFYSLLEKQSNTYIELHEYNEHQKYSFNYRGKTNDLNIILKAPEDNSFVFENGQKTKTYPIKIKQNEVKTLNFQLKPDYATKEQNSYNRKLTFSLRR